MSTSIAIIGKEELTGKPIGFDIVRLAETRLLITATSGGGKSWIIRKLIEESYGKIQIIVLDSEGEFASLRKEYDFILAGKDADIPVEIRSANLLAKKLLEFEASAIIDLYELAPHDRIRYVKDFLNTMVDAPKELWHPCLIILDEAHHYCSEKQQAESSSAVISMASKGRKRGYALVLASQRLAKLDKDSAAECLNKLVGVQSLDIDRRRASEEIGFYSREQILSLRDLEPGHFYAVGPAISKTVMPIVVGPVKTKHPKAGERITKSIPLPTEKVKTLLQKFTDLPQEAERELKEKSDMLAEITRLKRDLTVAKNSQPFSHDDLTNAYNKGRAAASAESAKELREILKKNTSTEIKSALVSAKPLLNEAVKKLTALSDVLQKAIDTPDTIRIPDISSISLVPPPDLPATRSAPDSEFGRCERAILKFLVMQQGHHFKKAQIGAMTGYAHKSGGFSNALSKLSINDLIIRNSDDITVNTHKLSEAIRILGSEFAAPTINSLENWLHDLPKCDSAIYDVLRRNSTKTFSREELGALTGYAPNSGGFSNAISHLVTLGLAMRTREGIRFHPDILPFV